MVLKLSKYTHFDFKNSNDVRIYLPANFLLAQLPGIKGEIKWSHFCQGALKWSQEAIKEVGLMYVVTGWNDELSNWAKPHILQVLSGNTCNLLQ